MSITETNKETVGTERFIVRLAGLKEGDLNVLRAKTGLGLDESLLTFDLFSGIWWNLRMKGWAPRRDVSWLITKLYAKYPFKNERGNTLAKKLGKIPSDKKSIERRFNEILSTEFNDMETKLIWVLGTINRKAGSLDKIGLDWVSLTNDLSNWDNQETKNKWIREFLNI